MKKNRGFTRTNSNRNENLRGFTLLELLVSVGVIAMVGTVIAQSFFATTRSSLKSEVIKETKQNGDFAINTMERVIRDSDSVTTPCLSTGSSTTSLEVENPDGTSVTFGCTQDSDITRITMDDGASVQNLTSGSVTLGGLNCTDPAMSLRFTCISYSDQPSSIGVSFTLNQRGTPVDQYEQSQSVFQTTVNLRNE